jgi:hypothetical protein
VGRDCLAFSEARGLENAMPDGTYQPVMQDLGVTKRSCVAAVPPMKELAADIKPLELGPVEGTEGSHRGPAGYARRRGSAVGRRGGPGGGKLDGTGGATTTICDCSTC